MNIIPKPCPVCGIETNYIYNIEETDRRSAKWYRCTCGVIFQEDFTPVRRIEDIKNTENNQKHAVKTYAPIIEELTYGRMLLQLRYEDCPGVMEEMSERGWITWGIDENAKKPGGNKYKGNILNYDFNPKVPDDLDINQIDRKFDVIWLQHYLEHQHDPIEHLRKCFELLSETGVLFISTPDIEFIHKQGMQYWPYWKRKENYVLWSERALKRELERIGYKVVMNRRNYAARFMGHFDLHFIAQKNYF